MLAILGLPIAVAMAWALEATPKGIRRERDHRREPATSRHAAVAKTSAGQPSIAVLPFLDMSPERDQDYFCEGMAEEILNALTRVDGLRVVARSSSFQFRARPWTCGRLVWSLVRKRCSRAACARRARSCA